METLTGGIGASAAENGAARGSRRLRVWVIVLIGKEHELAVDET